MIIGEFMNTYKKPAMAIQPGEILKDELGLAQSCRASKRYNGNNAEGIGFLTIPEQR